MRTEYCAIPYSDDIANLMNHEYYYIFARDRKTQVPLYLTDYDKYIIEPFKDLKKYSDNRQIAFNLVRFLNWMLEDAPEQYQAQFRKEGLRAVDFDAAEIYLKLHTEGKLKGMRDIPDQTAQKQQRDMLTKLLRNIYGKYRPDQFKNHFWKEYIPNGEYSTAVYELTLTLNHNKEQKLLRDLPAEVGDALLRNAYKVDWGIYLALFLQRYCALREGEVCNVRGKHSCYGPGYRIRKNAEGKIVYFAINLTKEKTLRSDNKSTGRVKKERIVEVPPEYLMKHPELARILDKMEVQVSQRGEKYGALFINKRKNAKTGIYYAMTTANYTQRVLYIMDNYVIPEITASSNDTLKIWVDDYKTHNWGLHALRHLASIEFVLFHQNSPSLETELMEFRGDTNPTSSLPYLRHLDRYRELYEKTMNKSFDEIRKGSLKKDQGNDWV